MTSSLHARRDGHDPHDGPLPRGDHNENPRGLTLLQLLREDLRTHDDDPLQPGFIAVALHRLGNARMDVRSRLLRAPLSLGYKVAFHWVTVHLGIDLPYNVKVGRRLRIWHNGGIVLGARAIGDDVHLRHGTTFGVRDRGAPDGKPVIGDRVELGVGACVFGAVTVGDDCVIGPHSVVLHDLPPRAVVMGVPARRTHLGEPTPSTVS